MYRDRTSSGSLRPSLEAIALWGSLALVLWLVGYATISGLGRNFDFRVFYSAGQLVREAPWRLYDLKAQDLMQNAVLRPHGALPFYHPAYEALLFVPLSLLKYSTAYFVYLGLNMLALGGCYLIAPKEGVLDRWSAIIVFLFEPVLVCLVFGQDSILFLLLLCVAWRMLRSDRDSAAGAVVALALFKLPVTPVIALLLCLRRGWRFAAGFFLMASALALLCVGITGVSGSVEFVRLLSHAALGGDAFPALMPTLHGMLYGTVGDLLSPVAFRATYGAVTLAILVVGIIAVRRAADLAVAFSTAIVCGVLLSPHLFGYDLAILILPMMLLKNRRHVIVAWGCFAIALCQMLPSLARFAGWAVVLPAALLVECVVGSGLTAPESGLDGSEPVMPEADF